MTDRQGKLGDDVVFVDCETTGVEPQRHEIWELGLLTPHGDGLDMFLNPARLDLADSTALRLMRFYDRWPGKEGCSSTRVAAEQVAKMTAGKHLVGAVPSFDAAFLTDLLRLHGFAPAWHYHLVDVEAMAAGLLGVAPPWDSEELSRGVGVEPDRFQRHTALGDARWAKAIYEAVLKAER